LGAAKDHVGYRLRLAGGSAAAGSPGVS
jgi:hypothetical protein